MADRSNIRGNPREWLNRARGKLALACVSLPANGFYEDLCFCAQQAAELAIKAVYQYKGWTFDYVHDIGRLLDGLERRGLALPEEVQDADQLSVYASQTRYPGIYAQVGHDEYEEAVSRAESVVLWAEAVVDE